MDRCSHGVDARNPCQFCANHIQASVESVTRPAHYGGDENPHEPIKVIEHYGLGFCLGNALKYLLRAGRKPGESVIKDLKKAHWYIGRAIERAEKGHANL